MSGRCFNNLPRSTQTEHNREPTLKDQSVGSNTPGMGGMDGKKNINNATGYPTMEARDRSPTSAETLLSWQHTRLI